MRITTADELCAALVDVVRRGLDDVDPLEAVAVVGRVVGIMIGEAPNRETKVETVRRALAAMAESAGVKFSFDNEARAAEAMH